ncbi:MAG: tRNA (N(6)-L-threonylcarbamoyladenosine(37)-C(2))-methylthiotransferase MtaB, partial [Candidatus Omnitrophica bacterium]|nr:tRNA (N(6)-L-threonylcarbamoyladenosine(37)-C(2))-methylthiotransferase MtaB [Candidatus Omnitrophota bacterium]
MRTIKFYTVGCKVNQYETQLMREHFLNAGFEEIDNLKPADLYLINTCTVTHKADADSLSFIRRAKRENPSAKFIVTGCLVELDEDKIIPLDKNILIVKNEKKNRILELIDSGVDISVEHQAGITGFYNHCRAFLKVQDGCNNFCSYCKVPLVRGRSRSKKPEDVISEIKTLIKNGYREIVLCGICLGSYGKDLLPRTELIDLLKMLDTLEGDFRIRLSSIEAWDITENFIRDIDKLKKFCPHLHIPIQSGDERILSLMNRPITARGYLEKIEALKRKIPFLVITTDVLVGFPSEKDNNFLNTLSLVEKIQPLKVHIFSYSPRPYTRAFLFKEKISSWEIKKRVIFLKRFTEELSHRLKNDFLGRCMRVLFESSFKEENKTF